MLTLPRADDSVALRVVPGTAVLHTIGKANSISLDTDALFGEKGVLVGCDTLDGRVTDARECEGWVTVDFITAQPRFTVEGWVATPGMTDYAINKDVRPGDVLSVKMEYKNIGNVRQNNVVLKIGSLPRCSSVVPGSTVVATSLTDGKWTKISDGIDIDHPINVGSYGPNGNVYVGFKVRVCEKEELGQEYDHSGHDGALWTQPAIKITVETDNGSDTAKPMYVTVLSPNQR